MTDECVNPVADARSWYQGRYEYCLEHFGADARITKGYKEAVDRIDRGVADQSVEDVYFSGHGRPLE